MNPAYIELSKSKKHAWLFRSCRSFLGFRMHSFPLHRVCELELNLHKLFKAWCLLLISLDPCMRMHVFDLKCTAKVCFRLPAHSIAQCSATSTLNRFWSICIPVHHVEFFLSMREGSCSWTCSRNGCGGLVLVLGHTWA